MACVTPWWAAVPRGRAGALCVPFQVDVHRQPEKKRRRGTGALQSASGVTPAVPDRYNYSMLRIGKIEIPDSELTFEFARSGGPGGQNVNKVETKVTVRFAPRTSSALTPPQVIRIEDKLASRLTKNGELLVSSELTRHREQNREDALKRLADLIRDALKVQKKRRPTRPTRASKERRLEGKKRKSSKKNLRRPPESE